MSCRSIDDYPGVNGALGSVYTYRLHVCVRLLIVSMETDRLMDRLGTDPILSVKQSRHHSHNVNLTDTVTEMEQGMVRVKAHLYYSESDIASDLLYCFLPVCLYYSDE